MSIQVTDIFTWKSNGFLKYNIQNLTSNLSPSNCSSFPTAQVRNLDFFLAHPTSNQSGNPVGSTFRLYPKSNLFLLPLIPPCQSHCHLPLGIMLQWYPNWSLCFYSCSTVLSPSLITIAVRMMFLNISQIMSLQSWWEKNLMSLLVTCSSQLWLHASSRGLSATGVIEKYKKLWVSYMCNKCNVLAC